ncbi:hypothetical protein X801_09236 [Opisthorchis viverrini]|uniref:Uncharacterized protein n=1 Tax=Opisthorchis viverrini TaxID=6198 RepID=A0A1S8WKJ2_OPIVI|nr:hypothetical protein X801_09236 [Opisthorchis viverrini]
MSNPSRKCFYPPVPKDVVLSFFLRGSIIVFAAYALTYNGHDKRWEISGRLSVEATLPRLQKVMRLLYIALDTASHLMDRVGMPR